MDRCVFQRVTDGVADHSYPVNIGTLAAKIAFFDILLGIVPCATSIGHHQRHHDAADQRASEHAAKRLSDPEQTR